MRILECLMPLLPIQCLGIRHAFHNLQIDYDCVNILGPVKIDLVDEENYNEVIEENIKPKVLDPRTSWPWSPDNPRPDDE